MSFIYDFFTEEERLSGSCFNEKKARYEDLINSGVLDYIYPKNIAGTREFHSDLTKLNEYWDSFVVSVIESAYRKRQDENPDKSSEFDSGEVYNFTRKFVSKYNLYGVPYDARLGGIINPRKTVEAEENINIALRGINIIDADKLTWEQISEFRRDEKSRIKLLRLRTYFLDKFKGKSSEEIQDQISLMIDEYNSVVKTWGFETTLGISGILLSSKLIGLSAIGGLVSVFTGAPTAVAISSLGPAAIELGKIGLYVAKERYELNKSLSENPISYLKYLEQRFE